MKRLLSLLIIFCFLAEQCLFAFAAPIQAPAKNLKPPAINSISIPEELGEIKIEHRSDEGSPFVVYIQDAHTILDAQNNIREMIAYLQSEYGLNLVLLEGGEGLMDPTLFRHFPDKEVREKVMQKYLSRGELTGVSMAAITNELSGQYYGIEDWDLYETNYMAYLQAVQNREAIIGDIESMRERLNKKRRLVYSNQLNALHEQLEAFYSEDKHLLDLLMYFSELKEAQSAIGKYSELRVLVSSLTQESDEKKTESLEQSIRSLADGFERNVLSKLAKEDAMKFMEYRQSFETSRMEPGAFLKWVVDKAAERGFQPKLTGAMKELLGRHETFTMIKGTHLFDELRTFIAEIEQELIVNSEQLRLSEDFKKLRLLENLANLEMSPDEWSRYSDNPSSFITIAENLALFKPALQFYALAEERDQIFTLKIKEIMKRQNAHGAIVIMGGFHAQGFERNFSNLEYSYAVVTPKIQSLEGHEVYEGLMHGNLSYKHFIKQSLYDGFARHASLQFVKELDEPNFRKNIKLWRDNVIRDLARQNRVGEASHYTQYIDLVFKAYLEKFKEGLTFKQNREMIERAIEAELRQFESDLLSPLQKQFDADLNELTEGLRNLRADDRLTPTYVRMLLSRVQGQKPAALVQSLANLFPELKSSVIGPDGISEEALSEELTARLERVIQEVSVASGLPAEAVSAVVRNIILKTTPLAADAPQSSQAGEGRSELREAYIELFDSLEVSFDAERADAFRALLQMADLSHLLRNPVYGVERSLDLTQNTIRAVIESRLRQAEERVNNDPIFAQSVAREIETLFVRMNQSLPVDLEARLQAVSESSVETILNVGQNTESGGLLIDRDIEIDQAALKNTKEILDRTVPFSVPGDKITTLLTVAGVKPGSLVFHNQPNRAGFAEAIQQANPNLLVIPEPSQAAGLFIGNREQLEFLMSQPAYQNFLSEKLGAEGANLSIDALVQKILSGQVDPGMIGILLGYPIQAVRDFLSPASANYTVGNQVVGWATQVPFDAETQALAEYYQYHAANLASQFGYELSLSPIRVNLSSSASNLTPPVPLTALVPDDKDHALRSRSESRIEIVDLMDMTEERIDEIIEIAETVYEDYEPALERELRQTILANREWSYAALSPEGRVEGFIILNPDPEDIEFEILAEISEQELEGTLRVAQHDIVEVVLVARHPDAERGSVIHELFTEAERLALSVNKTHLWLEFNPSNSNAAGAFRREGFEVVKEVEGEFTVMMKDIALVDRAEESERLGERSRLEDDATRFLREQGLDENGNPLRSESRTPENEKRAGEVAKIDELYSLMAYYDESKRLAGLLETAEKQVEKYNERKAAIERGSQWIDDRENELERVERRLQMAEMAVRELNMALNSREMSLEEVREAIFGEIFAITGEVRPQVMRRDISQLSLGSGVEAVVQGNYSSTIKLKETSRVYFLPASSLSDFIEIRRDPENLSRVLIKSRDRASDLIVDKTQFVRIGREPRNDIVLKDTADSRFQMAFAIDISSDSEISIRAQDIFSMNGSLIYWKNAEALGQRRDDIRRLHRRERVNDASIVIEREGEGSYEKGLVTGTFRLAPRIGGGTFEIKRQSLTPRLALITKVIDQIQSGQRESNLIELETAESALVYLEALRPILIDKFNGKGKSPYKGVEEIIEDLAVEVSALESNLGISEMEAFIWHLNHALKNLDPRYDLDQLLGHIGIALVTIQKLSGPEADPPVEKTATDKLIEQSIQLFFGDDYLKAENFDRSKRDAFIRDAGLQIEAFQRSETRKEDLEDLAVGIRHILIQTFGGLSGFLSMAAESQGSVNLDRIKFYVEDAKERINAFQNHSDWVRVPYSLSTYQEDTEMILPNKYAINEEEKRSVENSGLLFNDAPGLLGVDSLYFRPLLVQVESLKKLVDNEQIDEALKLVNSINQFIQINTEAHIKGLSILSAREIDTFSHINRARLHTNAQMYFGREGPTMLLFEAERVLNDQGIDEWQGPQVPKELYENKRVLSLAYGELPFFLAESARSVVGVDFDFNTIAYQKMLQKYRNLNPAEYPFMEVLKNAYSETNREELVAALREFQEFVRSQPQEDSLLPESNLEFVRGSITQLPYDEGSFDFIVMPFIFGHRNGIETREAFEAAINEMLRVLAPGGQILISPFFSDGPIDRYYSGIATDLFANWIFLNSGRNFTHRLSEPFQVFPESENMTHIKGEFLLISKPDEALSEKPRTQVFKRSETRAKSPQKILSEEFEAIPLELSTGNNRMLNVGPAFESLGLDASRIEPIAMSAIEPYIYRERATGKLYYAYDRNRMIGNLKQYVIFEKSQGLLDNLVEVRLIGEESDERQIVLTEIAESVSDERLLTSATRAEDALLFMLLFASWDHHPRVQHNIHAREINGEMRYVLYDYANAQSPNFVRSPLSRAMVQTAVDHFENMALEGDYLFDRIVQLAATMDPDVLSALNANIDLFFQIRSEARSEEEVQIANLVNITSEELIRLFLSDETLQDLRQEASETFEVKRENLRETLVRVVSALMADDDDEEQKIIEALNIFNEGLKQADLAGSLPEDSESILRPLIRNLLSQIRELQKAGALNAEYLELLPVLISSLRERMQPLSVQAISQNINFETLADEIKLGSQAAILRAADLSESQSNQLRNLLQDSPEALARMERLLQTETAVSKAAKDLGISITGDLNRRINRRELLALKENIKEIGHRFTAHGTGLLGGLRNLVNIIFSDGISNEIYVWPLALNHTSSSDVINYVSSAAYQNGPNYVIVDKSLENWNTTAGHLYYVVPEAGDRKVILEVLSREGRDDLIEMVQSKIITYEEFVSEHRSENRITESLKEILDNATTDELQILNFMATGNRAELFAPETELTAERRSSLFDKFARFATSEEPIEGDFATTFKYQGINGAFDYVEREILNVSTTPDNYLRTLNNLRERFKSLAELVKGATDEELGQLSQWDLFRVAQMDLSIRDRVLDLENIDDLVKIKIVNEALTSIALHEKVFDDGRFDSVFSYFISDESGLNNYWQMNGEKGDFFNLAAVAEIINKFPKYSQLKLKKLIEFYTGKNIELSDRQAMSDMRGLQKRIRNNLIPYYFRKLANGNNFHIVPGGDMGMEKLTPQIANFALEAIQEIPQPLSNSINERVTLTLSLHSKAAASGEPVSLGHYVHDAKGFNLNFYGNPTPEVLALYDITKTTHHEFVHLLTYMNPRLLESGVYQKLVKMNNYRIVTLNQEGELDYINPESVTKDVRSNLYYKNYVYAQTEADGSETLISFIPESDLEDPLVVKLREAGVRISIDDERRHILANVEEVMAYAGSELLDTPYSRFVMERFAGRDSPEVAREDLFKGKNIPYEHEGQAYEIPVDDAMRVRFAKSLLLLQQTILNSQDPIAQTEQGVNIYEIYFPQGNAPYLKLYVDDRFMNLDVDDLGDDFNTDKLRGIMFKSLEVARVRAERSEMRVDTQTLEAQAEALADRLMNQMRILPQDYAEENTIEALDALLDEIGSFLAQNNLEIMWFSDILEERSRDAYARQLVNGSSEAQAQFVSEESAVQFSKYIGMLHVVQKAIFNEYVVGADLGGADATHFEKSIDALIKGGGIRVFLSKDTVKGLPQVAQKYPGSVSSGALTQLMTRSYLGDNDVVPVIAETTTHAAYVSDLLIGIIEDGAEAFEEDVFGNETSLLARSFIAAQVARLKLKSRSELSAEKIKEHVAIALFTERFVDLGLQALKYENGRLSVNRELLNRFINQHLGEAMVAASA